MVEHGKTCGRSNPNDTYYQHMIDLTTQKPSFISSTRGGILVHSLPRAADQQDGGELTGCISSAPVRCTWTSGTGGRPPAPEGPSRFPSPSRRRSGFPGRRAPCPAWRQQAKTHRLQLAKN